MRKIAIFAMVSSFLGIGIRYALDGRWEVAGGCLLAGILWLFPSQKWVNQRAAISLLYLAGAGGAGVFMGYEPVWLLTHFVILLMAWDLDHFTRALHPLTSERVTSRRFGSGDLRSFLHLRESLFPRPKLQESPQTIEMISTRGEKGLWPPFYAHLKRLGIVAGIGWSLGMFALTVRLPTSFAAALLLGLLVFFSLRGIVRFLGQGYASSKE